MFCFGEPYLSTPFRNDQLIPGLILCLSKCPKPVTGCPCQVAVLVGLYTCCLCLISPGAAQTREAGDLQAGLIPWEQLFVCFFGQLCVLLALPVANCE